jgi:hypothetical protein
VAGEFRATSPAWSPTGKHLAFLIEDKVGAHVAVFDFGKGAHVVVGDAPMADPEGFSWSPDGRRLAYAGPAAENAYTGAIHVYDVASGQSRVLAAGSSPRWRADGSLVAVCGAEGMATFDGDSEGAYDGTPGGPGHRRLRPGRPHDRGDARRGPRRPGGLRGSGPGGRSVRRGGLRRLRRRGRRFFGRGLLGLGLERQGRRARVRLRVERRAALRADGGVGGVEGAALRAGCEVHGSVLVGVR